MSKSIKIQVKHEEIIDSKSLDSKVTKIINDLQTNIKSLEEKIFRRDNKIKALENQLANIETKFKTEKLISDKIKVIAIEDLDMVTREYFEEMMGER